MKSLSFDVLVVGAGIVGLSAALAMRQRGFQVALIDRGPWTVTEAMDPRVYAINSASKRLFHELGVWEKMDEERMSPYQHMLVWDAESGARIEFDARMIASQQLGYILEESLIKQALMKKISEASVSVFSECCVQSVQETKDSVIVKDGTHSWTGKLLMVADGANSATRSMLQVTLTEWPYHQHAIITRVQNERSHQKTAFQVFHPDGPLAFLPLVNPLQSSIVWSLSGSKAEDLMKADDETFSNELTLAFERRLGKTQVVDKRYIFQLHMRHAKAYSGRNWLLMGDAAHTIHPLAGQGLNLGLSDLKVWLEKLESNKTSLSSSTLLKAYQRQRKAEVWQMIALMGGIKTLFANPLKPVVALRGFGLRVCDNLSFMKRFLIEQAG